ncbi:MAG: histidine triad nucleotide-binding protein [Proteobacteria bacterium]|nr:histidine triad nucleotide-binding protein [Pseudomonadota bacterium]|tara:strand:+ start:465 stop:845 length:381 start_codon:yes stop_codon:yes gene_type:complete
MVYDRNNIFAKILREEIPCKKYYENDFVLAFEDVYPQRKIHILVIPKGEYTDLDDFHRKASDIEIIEFFKAITHVAELLKVSAQFDGYRVISNVGSNAGQEVPHLHFHLVGGEKIGRMLPKRNDYG